MHACRQAYVTHLEVNSMAKSWFPFCFFAFLDAYPKFSQQEFRISMGTLHDLTFSSTLKISFLCLETLQVEGHLFIQTLLTLLLQGNFKVGKEPYCLS
jgi:hypothetical protein